MFQLFQGVNGSTLQVLGSWEHVTVYNIQRPYEQAGKVWIKKNIQKKTVVALHVVSREVQLGFRIADFFVVLWDLFHFKKVGCSVAQFICFTKNILHEQSSKKIDS